MTVGWERAAASLQREAQRRAERREALRDGRSRAEWSTAVAVVETCARCGESTDDAFAGESGPICAGCFAAEEVAVATRPPTVGERLVWLAATAPAAGIAALLWAAVAIPPSQPGYLTYRTMVAFLLLGVLAVGWGGAMGIGAGRSVAVDVARRGEGWGWTRLSLSTAGAVLGLGTAVAGLGPLAWLMVQ